MNKKIVLTAILASFILIGVGLVSAVNTQTKEKQKELDKKDSPLFKIRTGKAITEEKTTVKNKIRNIITKFLENRIFLNFPVVKLFLKKDGSPTETPKCTFGCGPTARTALCPCGNNEGTQKQTIDECCPQVHSAAPPS